MPGIYIGLCGLLILADWLIKRWAVLSLAPVGSIPVIEGILRLTYVENYGAAFGILHGQRWPLIIITLAVLCLGAWLLLSGRLRRPVEQLSVSLILAGGAGNLIDRITRGFVVDYLDINELFSYPMFNLADCCVVIGAVLMLYAALISEGKGAKKENTTELPASDTDATAKELSDDGEA